MLSGNSQDKQPWFLPHFIAKPFSFTNKYDTSCRFFIDNFTKWKLNLTLYYTYLLKSISRIFDEDYIFCLFRHYIINYIDLFSNWFISTNITVIRLYCYTSWRWQLTPLISFWIYKHEYIVEECVLSMFMRNISLILSQIITKRILLMSFEMFPLLHFLESSV